ncbi:MAG: 50S ribosomal protein L6 [Abditibacteriota bacterium]|nr:50S ribosomal protein L6 [Abditibacteriota bacterium]MBP5093737.1 50S ribosomal protein L6 [Abditibacteriota bacterium]
MSRIGQTPIPLPAGVQISREDDVITVKGPKGTLSKKLPADITVEVEDNNILCKRPSNDRQHRALHGLVRSLVNNMVVGVTKGYEKRLNVLGVGYRAEMQGKNLVLTVGLSHQVTIEPEEGITFEVGTDTNTRSSFILVKGIDKEVLGQQAANIRGVRPPEPYKGKGIRYAGEIVRLKAGKAGKK